MQHTVLYIEIESMVEFNPWWVMTGHKNVEFDQIKWDRTSKQEERKRDKK